MSPHPDPTATHSHADPATASLPGDGERTADHPAAPPDHATTLDHPSRTADGVGTVIAGRYRLTEPLGEGGMGAVFLARQSEPVKRLVALKVIRAGLDSKAVLARFEAERQALALMDHPNIAKVLDAGTTDAGRPFFVMELVAGVPITAYCDARRLTVRERLELFVPVCKAIQHAHQKGVIHRDIKPSNVLVSVIDDAPVPKVIDFGVAKATGAALTDLTLEPASAASSVRRSTCPPNKRASPGRTWTRARTCTPSACSFMNCSPAPPRWTANRSRMRPSWKFCGWSARSSRRGRARSSRPPRRSPAWPRPAGRTRSRSASPCAGNSTGWR